MRLRGIALRRIWRRIASRYLALGLVQRVASRVALILVHRVGGSILVLRVVRVRRRRERPRRTIPVGIYSDGDSPAPELSPTNLIGNFHGSHVTVESVAMDTSLPRVILVIDTKAAQGAGVVIMQAGKTVFLVPQVAPEHLSKLDEPAAPAP